jgi:hypothetical protein
VPDSDDRTDQQNQQCEASNRQDGYGSGSEPNQDI